MTIIRMRSRLASEWTAANPVLEDGRIAAERDTHRIKVGDGATLYAALPYVGSAGGGIGEAPNDSFYHVRHQLGWRPAGNAVLLNVGTTAGTVAAGDDARLVGAVLGTRQVATSGSLTGGGTLAADRTLSLVGDNATPGNLMLYGTSAGGAKGWYAQPGGGGGGGLSNAYVALSDGTTTASASGSDTLRVRAVSTRVSVVVGSDAPTFGDNIALDVVEANLVLGNIGGTLGLAKGGTGQVTAAAAFDALSPATTKGDLAARGTAASARLPVGTDGYVLTADSTQALGVAWAAVPTVAAPGGSTLFAAVVAPNVPWTAASFGTAPPISATYGFVRNITTDQNYYEKAADTVCPNNYAASTAKMMTAYILLREKGSVLASESATVQTGENVGGTTAGLGVGDTLSLLDLLYGMMVPSGNDAAEVVARHIGTYIFNKTGTGTTGRVRFLAEMNAAAVSFGMSNTSYGSPHGAALTPNGANNSVNTTTARDLARLTVAAMTNSTIAAASLAPSRLVTITGANARTYTIVHSAAFVDTVGADVGTVGLKGGNNGSGQYSFAVLWQAPSGDVLAITLIASPTNSSDRYLDARGLFWEAVAEFGLDGRADRDASFGSVVLLVGGDSAIVDESGVARALTSTAVVRSSASRIVNVASIVTDGSTSHVDAADAADLSFGAGDFCVEFWFRGNGSVPAGAVAFVSKWDASLNQREWSVQFDPTGGALNGFVSTDGTAFSQGTLTFATALISPATFFNGGLRHLMLRRSGTEIAVYLNGEKGGTPFAIGAGTLFAGTARAMIGARANGASAITLPVAGVFDEVRITKGVARQTAAKFSPIPRRLPRA